MLLTQRSTLLEIWSYIRKQGGTIAADRVERSILDRIEFIAERPYIGHWHCTASAGVVHRGELTRVAEYNYTAILRPLPEGGGFAVTVPAMPEICTFGSTLLEAREMARDAIRCLLESASMTGEEIPPVA